MWAAPVVRAARAQTEPPGSPVPGEGGGTADPGQAGLSGPINQTIDPLPNFPPDDGCYASYLMAVDQVGPAEAFLTAGTACVGHSFPAGGPFAAFSELQNVSIDLTVIDSGLDVQLTATLMRSEAVATCGLPSDGTTVLVGASLTVNGMTFVLDEQPAPNTVIPIPETPGLLLTVILNEHEDIDGGIQVTAFRIFAQNSHTGQSIDLWISRTSAFCSS